jgi:hypothetical protein
MTWELVLRHCASIRASVDQTRVSCELISAQVAGLEAYATHQAGLGRATETPLPATCAGQTDEHCARRNADSVIELGGMGSGPRSYMCRGCGLNPQA